MDQAWIGIDVGKDFHWAVALDESGRELLSRRVENEEADIRLLLEEVSRLAGTSVWAVDTAQGPVALLAALLAEAEEQVLYVPGMVVNRSRGALAGDRRDARVIAEKGWETGGVATPPAEDLPLLPHQPHEFRLDRLQDTFSLPLLLGVPAALSTKNRAPVKVGMVLRRDDQPGPATTSVSWVPWYAVATTGRPLGQVAGERRKVDEIGRVRPLTTGGGYLPDQRRAPTSSTGWKIEKVNVI